MKIIARWSHNYGWTLYITDEITSYESTKCSFCIKKVRPFSVYRSKVFFKDARTYFPELNHNIFQKFKIVEFPVRVHEEAISLSFKHVPFRDLRKESLIKGLRSVINRGLELLKSFKHVIITAQDGYYKRGTLSHPQFRIFALPYDFTTSNLQERSQTEKCVIGAHDTIFKGKFLSIAYPWWRDSQLEALIILENKSCMELVNYNILRELANFLTKLISFGSEIEDYQRLVITLNLHPNKPFMMSLVYNNAYTDWPFIAFKKCGLNVIRGDPYTIYVKLNYYLREYFKGETNED